MIDIASFTNVLTEYGLIGVLIFVIIQQNMYHTKRIYAVIENNTKALEGVKNVIQKCSKNG